LGAVEGFKVRRWRRDGVGDFGEGCSFFGCFIYHIMVDKPMCPGIQARVIPEFME